MIELGNGIQSHSTSVKQVNSVETLVGSSLNSRRRSNMHMDIVVYLGEPSLEGSQELESFKENMENLTAFSGIPGSQYPGNKGQWIFLVDQSKAEAFMSFIQSATIYGAC
jgi:hypothetical protein